MQTQTEPNDAWHREFPRLAELRDCVPSTGEGTFFHGIPSIIQKSSLRATTIDNSNLTCMLWTNALARFQVEGFEVRCKVS